jgi:cytochrome P450
MYADPWFYFKGNLPENEFVSSNLLSTDDEYEIFCRGGLDAPYPFYDRMREKDTVHWSEILSGWILTRYDDIFVGLRDRRLSARRIHLWKGARPEPMRTEKNPLGDCLEVMRPPPRRIVDEMLDELEGRDEIDLVDDFSYPLPATVISDMISIPPADRDRFRQWSQEIVAFNGATSITIVEVAEKAHQSMVELSDYFTGLIDSCIEECLRHESPVNYQSCLAIEDMELGGKLIKRDRFVMNMLMAANRDPAKFMDPDRFDIQRKDNDHLAFGSGTHFCLGAHLARIEGRVASIRSSGDSRKYGWHRRTWNGEKIWPCGVSNRPRSA